MLGFGGVLPFARRMIVEQRRWLTAAEFTDLLALCQFLPGPNICNMTVALGRRYHGAAGALASILGLMGAPVTIAVALGVVYGRYGGLPTVAHALCRAGSGGERAGAGDRRQGRRRRCARRATGLAVAAVAFVAIAVLRLPLLPTMLVLAPVSVWLHRAQPAAVP